MSTPKDVGLPPERYIDGTPFPGRIGRIYTDPDCRQAFPVEQPAPPGSPNILFVVLDDVGFGWSSAFGGYARTPHIEQLASGGLRYTNFHTTSICAPTRASLLTGRNHHSVGMGILPEMVTGFPGYDANLPRDKAAIGAILRKAGYNTLAVGKWHNTPSHQSGAAGPYDRWPTGELYGFERFYGFLECEMDHYYPELYRDTHPVDPPATPDAEGHGYHLSEDLVENAISMIVNQQSAQGDDSEGGKKPWFMYLAFGACHAPHHVTDEWVKPYTDEKTFQIGWDEYRRRVLERQKQLGVVPMGAELPPMPDEIPAWDGLGADEKTLFTRMAEIYAGFLTHTDAQIGKLVDYLRESGQLDDTIVFVFIGDNGSSGEGTLCGLFNESAIFNKCYDFESVRHNLQRLDSFGKPGSYNHYPVGWAFAGNTPFRLCKQYTHFGGIRNPMVVHWPKGIKVKPGGELREQFHHVIDVLPTVLECIPAGKKGLDAPAELNGISQAPIEGTSMKYSFDHPEEETRRRQQYFEMVGNRAIVKDGWKAVTWHAHRLPWEDTEDTPQGTGHFDLDHWELYAVAGGALGDGQITYAADPTECHDLTKKECGEEEKALLRAKLDDLVTTWWAEAGRYGVLPLDDRLQSRASVERQGATRYTYFPGTTRVPEGSSPPMANRSWSITATIDVDDGTGAEGLLCSQGGCSGGWALYMKDGAPRFCYSLLGESLTYIEWPRPLRSGRHVIRAQFQKSRAEPGADLLGSGGIGSVAVDDEEPVKKVIPRTANLVIGTFDVGCEKGSPVVPTTSVPLLQPFAGGRIVRVDVLLDTDVHPRTEHARLAAQIARQ